MDRTWPGRKQGLEERQLLEAEERNVVGKKELERKIPPEEACSYSKAAEDTRKCLGSMGFAVAGYR